MNDLEQLAQLAPMTSEPPIRMAVVGHTNTGKTSLLRTLTRNRSFGEVHDAPGTTRHVQGAPVLLGDEVVLVWYDTPGLEDSMGLRDAMDAVSATERRLEGPDRVARFLDDPTDSARFEQESRVLKQVQDSDAVLYVVDVREPVLGKHRDELFVLQLCAKPVVPILNFTAREDAKPGPWVETFARHAMHITLSFDTVSPPVNGEQMLYGILAKVLSAKQETFERLGQAVAQQRQHRLEAALVEIASLCVRLAAQQRFIPNLQQALVSAQHILQDHARSLEDAMTKQLLALYQFGPDDYLPTDLPWSNGQWKADLFSAEVLAQAGLHVGKGAAAGALAGAAVDVMTAGLTLGAGTLVGAALGSAWQGVDRWGRQWQARLRGERELRIGDDVLVALATRHLQLLAALEMRGHAAQAPIKLIDASNPPFQVGVFLKALSVARSQPRRLATAQEHSLREREHVTRSLVHCLAESPLLKGIFTDQVK